MKVVNLGSGGRPALRPGITAEYGEWLSADIVRSPVSLGEGGTPLLEAPELSRLSKCQVYLKIEASNPTGTFKDRGMAAAVSGGLSEGIGTLVCASTGSTAASAAAFAARAAVDCIVMTPARGFVKRDLAQALMYGARVFQVDGSLEECHAVARKIGSRFPAIVVNSTNRNRIEGQKTAAFEIVDALGDAPAVQCLPLNNYSNFVAYLQGYSEYRGAGISSRIPQTVCFSAGSALRAYRPSPEETWPDQMQENQRGNVTAAQAEAASLLLARSEAVFADVQSSAAVAGMLQECERGRFAAGSCIVCTISGNGFGGDLTAGNVSSEILAVQADDYAVAAALGIA